MMKIKKILNYLRSNYYVAYILRIIFTPIQKACNFIDTQIRMKIWINAYAVKYDNIKISFPKNIGISYCSNIYWNDVDGFEKNTWLVMKHFIIKADLFMDVGSNIGFYSILAKKIKPELEIKGFEPIHSIFQKNIIFHKANSINHEHISNIALSDTKSTIEIFLPKNKEYQEEETTATLRKDSWQHQLEHTTFTVETNTIDNIVPKNQDKLFIKIDVEDYEFNVFKGAINTLKNVKPIIVCEILPREHGNKETIEFLNENQYTAFGITNVGLVRFNSVDFKVKRGFTDFLLVPDSITPSLNFLSLDDLSIFKW